MTASPPDAGESVMVPREWRCFHCDDVFTNERCARLHFGETEDSAPACKIKAGAEGSILRALRSAESEANRAWQSVADETTDAAKAYYAQTTRYSQALMAAEELGYERGLNDARTDLAAAPSQPDARDAEIARDAARWRALWSSDRIRMMGCAGFDFADDGSVTPRAEGGQHLGVEVWNKHPAQGDGEDSRGRKVLLAYVDARAALDGGAK